MNFPQKLISERARLGLTQAKTAAMLEISKSALEKWEAGTKTPLALTQEGALARLRAAKKAAPRKGQNAKLSHEEGEAKP